MFLKPRTKKAAKRGLALLLSVAMLGGSVMTDAGILRVSAAETQSPVEEQTTDQQSTDLIYFATPDTVSEEKAPVSAGDTLATQEPQTTTYLGEFDLKEQITAYTVTVQDQDIAEVETVEKNTEVSMTLAWSMDTYSITNEEGLAAFTYTLPEGIDWEEVDTVSDMTGYLVEGNKLTVYQTAKKDAGAVEGSLSISGLFAADMVQDPEGTLVFPDGTAFIAASVKKSGLTWSDVTTEEWAAKGLLPYENYVYGEATQSGYFEYDRNLVKYYDAILDLDTDELSEEDAEYVKQIEFVVNGGLGEIAEDTYFEYVEDVDTIIAMAEEGLDLNKFFYGNDLFGTTLDDLYALRDDGDDLNILLMKKSSKYKDISVARAVEIGGQIAVATTVAAYLPILMAPAGGSSIAGLLGAGAANSVTSMFKMNTGSVGSIPAFGPNEHGPLWDITTAQEEQGGPTMCAGFGKGLKTGDQLEEVDASNLVDEDQEAAITAMLELYDVYRYGDSGDENNQTHPLKVLTQCMIWYVLGGNGLSYDTTSGTFTNMVSVMDEAMSNIGLSAAEVAWANSMMEQWAEYYHYYNDDSYVLPKHRVTTVHFWDHVGGGAKQPLITWSSIPAQEEKHYGRLFAEKVDENGNHLAGCAFAVYNEDWSLYTTFIVGEERYVEDDILLPNDTLTRTFLIEEIDAPEGYKIDDVPKKVVITEAESETDGVTVTFVNKAHKPHISFVKCDNGTTTYVEGFGEFQVLNASGTVVETFMLGEGGPVALYLDPGSYTLHEVTPPKGYLAAADVPFTVTGNFFTDNGTVTVYEDYTKVRFAKIEADTNAPLSGAIVELYKADGYGNYSTADRIDRWTTDGTLHEVNRLEIGQQYAYVEVAAPDGYMTAEPIFFTVESTAEPVTITMKDSKRKYSILKIDESTGEALAGARLQLWDIDGNNQPTVMLDEWTSTTEAHVIEGLAAKSYLIREIEAPAGYTNFGDKIITFGHIHSASCYTTGTAAFTHVGYAQPNSTTWNTTINGTMSSTSDSAALTGLSGTTTTYIDSAGQVDEDEDEDPINGYNYRTGYTIDVTPGEIIRYRAVMRIPGINDEPSPMMLYTDRSWWQVTYDTDSATGQIISDKRYLSSYSNDFAKEYIRHESGHDEHEDIDWDVFQWGYHSGDSGAYSEYRVEGDEDDGDDWPWNRPVLSSSDEGGWVTTGSTLATGNYGFKNIWFPNASSYDFFKMTLDESYENGGTDQVLPSVYGTKRAWKYDAYEHPGDWQANETYVIYDSFVVPDGATSITITLNSVEEAFERSDLEHAITIYREVNELTCGMEQGDLTNQTVEVGNVGTPVHHISIKKVEGNGSGSQTSLSARASLAGASLELRNANNAVVESWVSDDKAHYITGIEPGTYTLVEAAAPAGYATAAPMTIVVQDTTTLQTFFMEDKPTSVKVFKLDRANNEALAGATLQIWTADNAGTPISLYRDFVTGLTEKTFDKMPVGKYVLIETKAPEGYKIADPIVFDVLDSGDLQTVTMYDDAMELHVSKKEVAGSEELPGAQLQIFTTKESDGTADKIYDSWTSTDEEHVINKIPAGNYILREIRAPKGYLEASDIAFTVTTDQIIHTVTMVDESIDITIDKQDVHTHETLVGAQLAIAKKEVVNGYAVPGKMVDEWTTDGTPHAIHAIEAGDYVIYEISAPTGYSRIGYKEITIAPISTVQPFVVEDDYDFMPFSLKKVDGTTGEVIESDAEFTLYEWSAAAGNYVVSPNFEIVRKADKTYSVSRLASSQYAAWSAWTDGNLYWTPDNQGDYYFVESKAPTGYVSDATPVYFNVLDSELINNLDATYKATNADPAVYPINDSTVFANQKTRNLFTKSDIVSGEVLSDAILQILEITGENIDGSFITTPVESWTSDKTEVHYFYDNGANLVEIASASDLPSGKTLITKNGHLIEGLKPGVSYIFRELTAPEGYVGYNWSDEATRNANMVENANTEEIRFTVQDNLLVAEHDMKDQRVVGEISITKEGEVVVSAAKTFTDTVKDLFYTMFGYKAGRVNGAKFAVYVKETIYTPDGTNTVATYDSKDMNADTLVATIETGTNGIAKLTGLPLGKYYIKETGAGDGDFLLNDTVAEVELKYQGQDEPVVYDSAAYTNDRQKVQLKVTKKADAEEEAQYYNADEIASAPTQDLLLPGAVFGIYNKNDIQGFAVDETTGIVTRRTDALVEADTLIETIETDANGIGLFASDLPCGIYYLKEIKAPAGYHTSDEVYEFDASYTGEDGDALISLSYDFYNKPTVVKITKYDLTNGLELPGAKLEVTDEEGNVVDSWTSTEEGHYIRHLELDKEYTLTEVLARDGYTSAESIKFTITDKDGNGNIATVQDVKMYDDRVVGEIAITKEGEVVISEEKTFVDTVKDLFYTLFGYKEGRIKGAKFAVYAKETIYNPDGRNTIAVYGGVELKADTLIATIETDETGIAKLTGLPLGKYYIKETGAGEGDFLLNDTVAEVELKYQGQDVPVVRDSAFYENARQKVELTVTKRSSAQLEGTYYNADEADLKPGEDLYIADAVFGIYNKNDIQGYEVDAETGIVTRRTDALLKADTLIETITTDGNGVAKFVSDLPCGTYYLKEIKAPAGYHTSDEVYEFGAEYTGEEGEPVISLAYDFYNTPTVVKITKYDITNSKELPGAHLEVRDKEGNVVDEWTSTEEGHYIRHLELEETYTLVETKPADGYTTAESIEFTVKDKDETGSLVVVQEVKMYDDITKTYISKRDIDYKDMPEKPDLSGAQLELWRVDANRNKVKLMDSWVSEKLPHYIEKLPVGEYVLVEVKAPSGYERAEDLYCSVKDTNDKQYLTLFDVEEDEEEIDLIIEEAKLNLEDQTGEGSHILLMLAMAVCFIGAASSVALRRAKKRKED